MAFYIYNYRKMASKCKKRKYVIYISNTCKFCMKMCKIKRTNYRTMVVMKSKLKMLPVLAGPLSAIQPFSLSFPPFGHPQTFYFPWPLSFIRKQAFMSHWETISLSVCLQPAYGAEEYQTCIDTALLRYQFTPWSSGASEIHFLCPEKFTLGQCKILSADLSICSRTHYH